jgi:chromosome segregation ATPase
MKRIFAMLMVMLCGTAVGVDAGPASRPSNTWNAYRKVQIDAPEAYSSVIEQFDSENRVPQFSAADVFVSAPPMIFVSPINYSPSGDEGRFLTITAVSQAPAPAIAAETADKIVTELRSQLAKLASRQRDSWKLQLKQAMEERGKSEQQREQAENNVAALKSDLADMLKKNGLADPSPQSVRELANSLEGLYETTGVDISGKTARQTAIANAIAKLSDQVAQTLSADPITDQLQEVVEVRQKEFDDVKRKHPVAVASDADVDRAVAALAEAKAAVLERKEAAANAAGADTIHKWNNDLLSLSIDLDELNARMKDLQSRLDNLRQALDLVEGGPTVEALSSSIAGMDSHLAGMSKEILKISELLGTEQPKLTVVESKDNQPSLVIH